MPGGRVEGIADILVAFHVLDQTYSVEEICAAAEKASGFETVESAQRIGELWRLYPKTVEARVILLTRGLVLRGYTVQPRDKTPFIVMGDNGTERETPAMKLIIGNVPISYSNTNVLPVTENLGEKTRSLLIGERHRDGSGKPTRWKIGKRFLLGGSKGVINFPWTFRQCGV